MSNKLILWTIVLAACAGLIISANIFRDKPSDNISQNSPTPLADETASPSLSPSSSPLTSPVQVPAACQITGQIVFLNKNLYENKNAKITYQNVDDPIRQIFWKTEPADGALTIGPNLFEDLPLPDGERNVGVALAKETNVRNYTLTASITYGVKRADGSIEEKISNCSGEVLVQMP